MSPNMFQSADNWASLSRQQCFLTDIDKKLLAVQYVSLSVMSLTVVEHTDKTSKDHTSNNHITLSIQKNGADVAFKDVKGSSQIQ